MPLASGTRLGPYEVLAPLGAGGMGEVYRALDTRLGRDIALKLLPPELSGSPDRLARFEREARTVAKLSHPNIVVLYSVDEHEGTKFLTMELVDGKSLADMIAPGGLPLDRVLELAIALSEALAAAHEKGVVHRDLKPANVMLTRDGRVKVLDFGLAKHFQAGQDEGATLTAAAPISEVGQVLGTMPYMAPEQIRGENVDVRTDLYALGVLLYELVSGKRPFGGATSMDLASSILRDEAPDLAGVPEDFQRVLGRCLQKNPRERYQTAIDVGNELRRVGRGATRPALKSSKAEPSVAVLPFANRSADPEDEFFADGLADELLSTLARLSGLRVAARTSSSQFRGTKDDLATIGRKLNVESIIEGSVRKAGNRVRISVQLVKVVDGYRVWSDTYDRTLDDVFAVQDDIAQSVVKALRRELLGDAHDSDASRELLAEVANAARYRSANPEAQRLFVQARAMARHGPVESHAHATELLERAVNLDPAFALAWAELGDMLRRRGIMSPSIKEFERNQARADEYTARALDLDPDLPEAHASRGMLLRSKLDWRGANAALRRALELDPGSPLIQYQAGLIALVGGDVGRAEALLRQSLEADPLNHAVSGMLGVLLAGSDRHEEAIENYERCLELSPNHPTRRASLSWSLLAVGRREEAFAQAHQESSELIRWWRLALLFQEGGQTEEADRYLARLIETYSQEAAVQIALVYAHRGDADTAFRWFERARELKDPGLSEAEDDVGESCAPFRSALAHSR